MDLTCLNPPFRIFEHRRNAMFRVLCRVEWENLDHEELEVTLSIIINRVSSPRRNVRLIMVAGSVH